MNRSDLRNLSNARLREARALLDARLFDGAYYLSGYAVECALKACIAKKTRAGTFPDKGLANEAWKHNLVSLVKTAGLQAGLDAALAANSAFQVNWNVVKNWDVGVRYELGKSEREARDMYSACAARTHGVLSWVKSQW